MKKINDINIYQLYYMKYREKNIFKQNADIFQCSENN